MLLLLLSSCVPTVCRVLPEFHWVVVELVGCILVEEVLFYYSHWLLHHKK
jgi:hypothetical protein